LATGFRRIPANLIVEERAVTDASNRSKVVVLLWLAVAVEILSPIPAFLSVGTIYVLLFRPPSFYRLVQGLYREG
jgi:hypothetical protein